MVDISRTMCHRAQALAKVVFPAGDNAKDGFSCIFLQTRCATDEARRL